VPSDALLRKDFGNRAGEEWDEEATWAEDEQRRIEAEQSPSLRLRK